GRAALEDLLDRLGPEAMLAACEALRLACRPALARLLAGLEAEALRGRAGRFAAEVRPDAEEAVISLSGEGGARPSAAQAAAAVRAAVRQVLAVETPSLAVLGDLADSVRVALPAEWSGDVPTGEGRFALAQGVAAAVLAAFADAVPHMTHAPDAGCPLLDLRGRRPDGRGYRLRLGLGAGLGASVFGDGLTHAGPAFSMLRLAPLEEIERAVPVRVLSHALLPDSAGPGQYRGGLGSRLELLLLEGRALVDVLIPGRASGLRGGMRGAPGRLLSLTPEDGTREIEGPARVSLELRAGHRLTLESPGGGGWGIPFQRSMMRLEEDLLRGLITPDQAKNRYGLVVKPGTLEKDAHLTYRIRHYLLSTLAVEDIVAGEELLD
ncbi:MAG TPA: hydantoinase B/oxoprolinase family protein, partial [Candidatus Sulfotelmatobacter sp.]|nr:hydantoinase B/oxoprolinase family protein [Candidatus Sulfotelmatobacter sp.]